MAEVAEYVRLGKLANQTGESLTACDLADEGLKQSPADKTLRQIKALALARMGSRDEAAAILEQLRAESHSDEETLGLLARTYKDLWLASGDPADLERALDSYLAAYGFAPEKYWTGINAATLAFAGGDAPRAAGLARRIREECFRRLPSAKDDEPYWITATLAEAALLSNDLDEAERRYAEAAGIGRGDFGNLSTTWRNARIILRFLPPEISPRMERAIQVPKVAVFAGHRVDQPGQPYPRLPEDRVAAVKSEIERRLRQANARVGYSSAASGSDILFLEAIEALGGRAHIVLPCNQEQFVRESVASSAGDWAARFEKVLAGAAEVIVASNQRLSFGSVAYDYSNDLVHGLAVIRAQQLETGLVRMAVWDGRPGFGKGGTADIVERWQAAGHPVEIVWPDGMPPPPEPARTPSTREDAAAPMAAGFSTEIRAMIFADAFHFSSLTEGQIPDFIQQVMGRVAALARRATPPPLYQNTWGDGLFFVFPTVRAAGNFALQMVKSVGAVDRGKANLPEDLHLRIGLHAGPVYRFKDQLIERMNYIGSHVNRAARIEPVTPPGCVYASDAFAALAALDAPGEFRFDYVGRIPLAKSFGNFPLYRVRRAEG